MWRTWWPRRWMWRRCRGERFQPGRHEPGIMVKAVTYHLMEIKETPEGWIVRVVFDT